MLGTQAFTLAGAVLLTVTAIHAGADWPQWQGPDRTRLSKETGLLKQWPEAGPPVAWTTTGLGSGYGLMAVVVIASSFKARATATASSLRSIVRMGRKSGRRRWGLPRRTTGDRDRAGHFTVDGDRLYALSENGDLACLETDGTAVWQRNILREFGGRQLKWLISESPLVDGPHVIVSPGGPGASMVKLDKMTGKTVWTSKDLSDPAAYSSVITADVQGVRTVPDVYGVGGCRRACVRWQADVPVSERRELRRQRRDADLLEQQGVLLVRVRHRKRASRSHGAERRGESEEGGLHAQHEEPSRRRRSRRRLSVRVQRLDIDPERITPRAATSS